MPIQVHSYPSSYDIHGSRNHSWNDFQVDFDDQTWLENSLYRRRHEGLYLSKFEREDSEEKESN
jgi:hypothetical protein